MEHGVSLLLNGKVTFCPYAVGLAESAGTALLQLFALFLLGSCKRARNYPYLRMLNLL